ncbi:DUF2235 domain-containing protein [Vibrio diazotrophicus]|uniref:phospholipase effector Tle1 domain-containing protein n=1 Tax=Vibrio diazotrophicus TaxID=685 RepID=UPI0022AFDCD6|nr:DUF2235 domain-containing protein [Vibrio diazotrophicus]MCZ4372954.1 DUF2235 domain-containing protein [Vibrio diazotrophicus]
MSTLGVNSCCLSCEQYKDWIEIVIRDEHNKPFPNIKGILTGACGATYPITVGEHPIFLDSLASGRVSITLENDLWLEATQSRLPAEGKTKGLKDWLSLHPHGYNQSVWKSQTLALGDFIQLKPNQEIPKRHLANACETPNLVTGKSHYITIQGCRYITLRLGVFFDGTANNTYSAKWGKKQLDKHVNLWKASYEASNAILRDKGIFKEHLSAVELIDKCFEYPPEIENLECASAKNELTNIQKLFDLYRNNEFSNNKDAYYHAQYITGIGTGNSTEIAPADEDQECGQGMGIGKYGVLEKVKTGIEQICNQMELIISNAKRHFIVDGFHKVEFDVFGFSRGAAAARHFINTVFDNNDRLFQEPFSNACISHRFYLTHNFDWNSNEHCCIAFAGLFDTVAAVANFWELDFSAHDNDNGPIKLWLNPDRVAKAVHLVASSHTEYRHNFSVNLLNKAPHFDEIVVPGAHSDIGGGYHSRQAFSNKSYLLPLLENQLIKSISKDNIPRFEETRIVNSMLSRLEKSKEFDQSHGWSIDSYLIPKHKIRFAAKDNKYAEARLLYRNCTEGDLSRLYLRVMFGLAVHHGVPFDDSEGSNVVWNKSNDSNIGKVEYYTIPKSLYYPNKNAPPFPFGEFCQHAMDIAKSGNIIELQETLGSPKLTKLFQSLNLIHHSSNESLSSGVIKPFIPNLKDNRYLREEYECEV